MHKFFILILGLILGLTGCTFESAPIDIEDNMTALNQKKGWSVSGALISGAGGSGQGVSLQANFEDSPGNYTLQFGIVAPPVQSGEIVRALAEITWSVEGNDVRRLVDCVNGMSVSGTAQAVKVKLYDNSVVLTPTEYQVSAQVVKGTRPSVVHPPFLYGNTGTLAAGATVLIPVPKNAGVTSVYVPVAVIAGGVAAQDDILVSHQIASTVSLVIYDPRNFQWVPIAAGTDAILIGNSSVENVRYTPVWGIDG